MATINARNTPLSFPVSVSTYLHLHAWKLFFLSNWEKIEETMREEEFEEEKKWYMEWINRSLFPTGFFSLILESFWGEQSLKGKWIQEDFWYTGSKEKFFGVQLKWNTFGKKVHLHASLWNKTPCLASQGLEVVEASRAVAILILLGWQWGILDTAYQASDVAKGSQSKIKRYLWGTLWDCRKSYPIWRIIQILN